MQLFAVAWATSIIDIDHCENPRMDEISCGALFLRRLNTVGPVLRTLGQHFHFLYFTPRWKNITQYIYS